MILAAIAFALSAGWQAQAPAPLTELEALRVQVVNLERVIVQRSVEDWQKKVAALKAELEAARSGWEWSSETGEWQKKESKN